MILPTPSSEWLQSVIRITDWKNKNESYLLIKFYWTTLCYTLHIFYRDGIHKNLIEFTANPIKYLLKISNITCNRVMAADSVKLCSESRTRDLPKKSASVYKLPTLTTCLEIDCIRLRTQAMQCHLEIFGYRWV